MATVVTKYSWEPPRSGLLSQAPGSTAQMKLICHLGFGDTSLLLGPRPSDGLYFNKSISFPIHSGLSLRGQYPLWNEPRSQTCENFGIKDTWMSAEGKVDSGAARKPKIIWTKRARKRLLPGSQRTSEPHHLLTSKIHPCAPAQPDNILRHQKSWREPISSQSRGKFSRMLDVSSPKGPCVKDLAPRVLLLRGAVGLSGVAWTLDGKLRNRGSSELQRGFRINDRKVCPGFCTV